MKLRFVSFISYFLHETQNMHCPYQECVQPLLLHVQQQ
jgi:hypothetical protein